MFVRPRHNLLLLLGFFSLSASSLENAYIKFQEPPGWKCVFQKVWTCVDMGADDLRRASITIGVNKLALPEGLDPLESVEQMLRGRKLVPDSRGRLVPRVTLSVKRRTLGRTTWIDAVSEHTDGGTAHTRTLGTLIDALEGDLLILIWYQADAASFAQLKPTLDRALESVELVPTLVRRFLPVVTKITSDPATPAEVVYLDPDSNGPSCARLRHLPLTQGVPQVLTFGAPVKMIALDRGSQTINVRALPAANAASTLLLTPMRAGRARFFAYDEKERCKIMFQITVIADSFRESTRPKGWSERPFARTRSPAETTRWLAKLPALASTGKLESGNPAYLLGVGNLNRPMWLADPEVVDFLPIRLDPTAPAGMIAIAGKRIGRTTLTIFHPVDGTLESFAITVSAHRVDVRRQTESRHEAEL